MTAREQAEAARKAALFVRTPPGSSVEVFRIKGDEIIMKKMTFEEYVDLKKLKGYKYIAFEVGFSSLKTTK